MTDCVLWTGYVGTDGYGRKWSPMINGKRRLLRVTRMVMAEIHGWSALEGKTVNHHCDNTLCINPDHLYIGTQAENLADMHRRGRWQPGDHRGEHNGRSKLSAEQVREMRESYTKGETQTALSRRFGIAQPHVSQIVRGQSWRHL